MENQNETEKKSSKKPVIALSVALCATAAVCVFLLLRQPKEEEPDRGFVDRDNVGTIMSEMGEKVENGMFECKMTTSWVFENGKAESTTAYVANVENNRHALYFDVYDRSTDELLYSSPILPLGTEIGNIKLDKDLDRGEYEAVVMYTLVDENEEEVSKVGFNITISVNN